MKYIVIVKYYFLYNILAQVANAPGRSLPSVHFFGLKTSRLLARSNVCTAAVPPHRQTQSFCSLLLYLLLLTDQRRTKSFNLTKITRGRRNL